MDQAMAGENDFVKPDFESCPSSPCPKCGIRPRRQRWGYCKECALEDARRRRLHQKTARRKCDDCGQTVPHKGNGHCPAKHRRYLVSRGRQLLNGQWPDYGNVVNDVAFLRNVGSNWGRATNFRFPRPSAIFTGLDDRLDDRLIREHRDKNVVLCRALATVPKPQQRDFLELYLVDPADAQHWLSLPRWQRPIRKGDPDDVLIWKFFIMQRLNMEQAAREAPPWEMASQGAQLPQMFGAIRDMTMAGVQKLCLVMSTYGVMLQHREDVGDVVHPPWKYPV